MSSKQIRIITSRIRQEWMTYPGKFKAIQRCAERIQLPDGRMKTLIRCQRCFQLHPRKDIQANHIEPVGALQDTTPEAIEAYKERMFCHYKLIEPLCRKCHQALTYEQRNNLTTH